jgi:acetolactate decarboxylase
MDGKPMEMHDRETTPFATVTWFDTDVTFELEDVDYAGFKKAVDGKRSTENLLYAIRVDGRFSRVKARSVPRQERPYPPLAEVVKKQAIFEIADVEGTLVGFWCPAFVKGVNVPGYHLHFLGRDRTTGGHVLDFTLAEGSIRLDASKDIWVVLPTDEDFLGADLSQDLEKELHVVEQDR